MNDQQMKIVLDLLHHVSDKVDSMVNELHDVQIQTALNADAITRHTQQTSSLQLSMNKCQEECDKRTKDAINIGKYFKWITGTILAACTIIAAILEIYHRF